MENSDDTYFSASTKAFKAHKNLIADNGLENLIEAAELLRRNKIEPNKSYSEVFFSAAKQYIV